MRFAAKPLVVIALVLGAVFACAPVARAEDVQVPFDRAGRVRTIDLRTARRLGMFADTTRGFQEARLFRLPDSSLVLERTSVREGLLVRERSPLSAADADSLRERVGRALEMGGLKPEAEAHHSEGQLPLVLGSVALGVGFYSWAIPVSFETNGTGSSSSLYLLTLSSSFFLPWMIASQSSVTYAMSNLALYGATRGIAHGALLQRALEGDVHDGWSGHPGLRWAVAGSLAEGTLGYLWARSEHMDNGTAGAITTFGDFGMLEAGCAAGAAGMFDRSEDRGGDAAIVAGGAAGMLAGRMIAGARDYSYGDASVMRTSGMLGVLAGLTMADALDHGESKTANVAAMTGGALGLVAGDRLVANRDFTAGAGVAVSMGSCAGALFGLGVAGAASGGHGESGSTYWVCSLLGAVGGYALTYSHYAPEAERAAAEGGSSWNVEVSPAGLLAALPQGGAERRSAAAPALVSVRYRFP